MIRASSSLLLASLYRTRSFDLIALTLKILLIKHILHVLIAALPRNLWHVSVGFLFLRVDLIGS